MVGQWHHQQAQSNAFSKASWVMDVQISQFLKFHYAQYMENLRKYIFWPCTHPNIHYTLCPLKEMEIWPHLLSKCKNRYIHVERISRHKKFVHAIAYILFSSNITRCYMLMNAGTQHNQSCNNTLPS